jgi:hypothetical protein
VTLDLDRITHPLRLAAGSYQPGSGKGCAMNVISYINGDTMITDYPACSARPLARLVQGVNDILADADGFLSPENSVLVLDLGWLTVGTADTSREVLWRWLADILVDPEHGVAQYVHPDGVATMHRVAGLCVRAASGDMPKVAEWRRARDTAAAYAGAYAAADVAAAAAAYNAAYVAADNAAAADVAAAAYAAADVAAAAYAAAAADVAAAAYAAAYNAAAAAAAADVAAAAYVAADNAAAAAYAAAAAAAYNAADAAAAADVAAAAAAAAYAAADFTRWAITRWRDLAGLPADEINTAAVDSALAQF